MTTLSLSTTCLWMGVDNVEPAGLSPPVHNASTAPRRVVHRQVVDVHQGNDLRRYMPIHNLCADPTNTADLEGTRDSQNRGWGNVDDAQHGGPGAQRRRRT